MRDTLVIFDDTCSMCTRSVRFVRAFDWLARFRYTGFSTAAANIPELSAANLESGLRVRLADGSFRVGIDAVRSIAMRTPLGALLAWLLYVPPVHRIGDRAYRAVAARRHNSCRLPRR